ncbi:MAG TPA: hypothetical protein VHQ90_24300 [Thermoanaerobaculia bacterium]|nr:hypothetical protein [Thermoanaerobaculia bacterium]
MRDLAKSAFSASLAMPLFGLQQMANLLRSPGEVDDALDHVAKAAEASLGGTLQRLFQIGDRVGNGAVDLAAKVLDPRLYDPEKIANLATALARRSAAGLQTALSGGSVAAFEELRNKIQVFLLVQQVAKLIGEAATPPFPLRKLVDAAYALGDFRALWAVEGLGHDYAESFFRQGIQPHGILSLEKTPDLPAKSLTMLNAGIGLGIVQNRLENLPPTPYEEVRRRVAEAIDLCRDNVRPGYFGAAVEQLGLYPQVFNQPILSSVDRAIREVAGAEAGEILGYFWHGVGRALFFSPINFLPCSDWQLFAMARQQAPDEAARLSAYAGVAWAYTVVNQRQPHIMAELLIGPHGAELARDGGFVNGLQSVLIMRQDVTPDAEDLIASYQRYQAKGCEQLWERLVRAPAEQALQVYHPALARHNHLGDIFRYQDLDALVGGLAKAGAAGAGGGGPR